MQMFLYRTTCPRFDKLLSCHQRVSVTYISCFKEISFILWASQNNGMKRQPLSQHPYGKAEPVLFLNKYILKIAIKLQHIQEKPGETSQKAKDKIVTTKCSYTTETRQGKEGRNTGGWQERREDDRRLWMGCRKARGKSICSALMLLRAFSLSFVLIEQGVTFLRTLCDSGKRRYWSKLQVFGLTCFS